MPSSRPTDRFLVNTAGQPQGGSAAERQAQVPGKQTFLQDRESPLILIVDDNRTNINLVQIYLKRMRLTSRSASSGTEALESAKKYQPDLILLDVTMPEMDGLEVCRILKEDSATSAIPIIFLSARKQVDHRVSGMSIGAVDYITKPFEPSELEIRIRTALRTKGMQDMLVRQASTDPLTGLHNWRCFHETLSLEAESTNRGNEPLSLVLMDLDMFKVVNDSYGHQMGDKVLCDLGAMILANVRPTDHVARYGGDELAVIMPRTGSGRAKALAERLRSKLAEMTFGDNHFTMNIAGSFGLVTSQGDEEVSAKDLVRMADEALYTAKRNGRNQVCVWREDNEEESPDEDPGLSGQLYRMRSQVASVNARSRKQAMESMWTLVKALEARDHYSGHHSENVTQYAVATAKAMGLASDFIEHIRNAAMLHDLGKIGIPDKVLKKVGKLAESEWEMMKQHPLISAEIIGQLTVLKQEVRSIKHHHEHIDGSGYPDGLVGEDIPMGARILAVADAFDAITSDRIYREASDGQAAIGEIMRCAGSQFDRQIVEAFVSEVEHNEGAWPIRYKCPLKTSQNQDWRAAGPDLFEILRDSAEEEDEWLAMQERIEQSLASLAESLGKLSASHAEQDEAKLTVLRNQFRDQTEELTELAKAFSTP